jgi:hypothetical protein
VKRASEQGFQSQQDAFCVFTLNPDFHGFATLETKGKQAKNRIASNWKLVRSRNCYLVLRFLNQGNEFGGRPGVPTVGLPHYNQTDFQS